MELPKCFSLHLQLVQFPRLIFSFFFWLFKCLFFKIVQRKAFFHVFKSLTFLRRGFYHFGKSRRFLSPSFSEADGILSQINLRLTLEVKVRDAIHGPWSFARSLPQEEAATCRPSLLFFSQRRRTSRREELRRYWYLLFADRSRFSTGVVAHIRGGIHCSNADRIPPWVFTVHQWTQGVALVKDNIAVTAAAAPGSDGTATARRRTSGARVRPTERPAI